MMHDKLPHFYRICSLKIPFYMHVLSKGMIVDLILQIR